MPSEMVNNLIVIAIVIGFLFSLKLSDRPKHVIYGIVLSAVGSIRLLNYYEITAVNIPNLPAVSYAVNIVAMIVGGGLIFDSIKERSIIKWSSFLVGVAIVVLAVTPTLYGLNAITFNIPSYPEVINYYLHVSAGFLLLLGAIIVGK